MSKEQLYFKILQDVAARIRRAVENYEVDKDPERMKQELISILEGRVKQMADSPEVMVEHYESLKREEIKLSKESLEKFKQRYTDFGKFHWMDAQEIVVELERVQSELTEKDATIKELQDEVKKWRTQAEAKILFVSNGNNERMYELQEDNISLRKALEEARSVMEDALSIGEARHSFDQALCPWCDLIMGVEAINAALGEGDKHE